MMRPAWLLRIITCAHLYKPGGSNNCTICTHELVCIDHCVGWLDAQLNLGVCASDVLGVCVCACVIITQSIEWDAPSDEGLCCHYIPHSGPTSYIQTYICIFDIYEA